MGGEGGGGDSSDSVETRAKIALFCGVIVLAEDTRNRVSGKVKFGVPTQCRSDLAREKSVGNELRER